MDRVFGRQVTFHDMKTETEKAVDEIKSPAPSEETVEAAKQILADVLTKAVDAIKEETSSASLSGNFELEDPDKCNEDEKRVDYVIMCVDETINRKAYVGENYTLVQDPFKAKSFDTAEEAKKFVEDKQDVVFVLKNVKIFMRKLQCSMYEMTFRKN